MFESPGLRLVVVVLWSIAFWGGSDALGWCDEAGQSSLMVAAVSCEVRVGDVEGNLQRIAAWTERAAVRGAQVVLFPECSLHGWWQTRENRKYAETLGGPSVERVKGLAREHGVTIVVGMNEREGDAVYLTQVLVFPDGTVRSHRKSELAGGAQGEGAVWSRGEGAEVFEIGGFCVGVAICFESVHPGVCQSLKAQGAEVILAPYANGTSPSEIRDPKRESRTWMWKRVQENRVWYVACDATPHAADGSLLPGAAYVVSPTLELVACTPEVSAGEGMVIVEIPKSR